MFNLNVYLYRLLFYFVHVIILLFYNFVFQRSIIVLCVYHFQENCSFNLNVRTYIMKCVIHHAFKSNNFYSVDCICNFIYLRDAVKLKNVTAVWNGSSKLFFKVKNYFIWRHTEGVCNNLKSGIFKPFVGWNLKAFCNDQTYSPIKKLENNLQRLSKEKFWNDLTSMIL